MIAFPRYQPDKSAYDPTVSGNVLNVRPVANGWAPMQAHVPLTQALANVPRGFVTVVSDTGSVSVFAGTATKLYKLQSDGSWDDVSGAATFAVPAGDFWSFAVFGNRVIAAQAGNAPVYYDIGSSTDFAALPGSPPTARFVHVVGDFVVLSSLASNAAALAWSGINNSEQWTYGQGLSDTNAFPDGGEVMGLVPTAGGAFVMQRNAVRMMQYAPGSQFTFTFSLVNDSKGVIAPYSITKIGVNDFIYLSDDGFYRGPEMRPVGAERVDRTLTQISDQSRISEVYGAVDPFEKSVLFTYPKGGADRGILGYDWQLDEWFASDASVYSPGVYASPALSIEDIGTLFPGGLETITLSLDDKTIRGGRPGFAAFDASYRLGYFNGLPMACEIETASMHLVPDGRAFLRSAQVVGDIPLLGPLLVRDAPAGVLAVNYPGRAIDAVGPIMRLAAGTAGTYPAALEWSGDALPSASSGRVPFRKSGRLHRFRLRVGQGVAWNIVTGILPDFVPEGAR